MFSDVQLMMNEKIVDRGDFMYPYKAYISNLFSFDKNMKKTQLRDAGFVMDMAGKFDMKDNPAHKERSKWIRNEFELMGALQLGIFEQDKYLIPKVNLRLKFTRAKEEFYMMNFGKDTLKLTIQVAKLYVRRVIVAPSIWQAHEDRLKEYNATYPHQNVQCTNFTIPRGAQTENREILIGSDCPKIVIVGFVDNKAFNGDFKKNPFHFQHYDVEFMSLLKNGQSLPSTPLELDFDNGKYMRAYMNMIQGLELYCKDESNGITPYDFANGSTFFIFNLTPDLNYGGSCGQKFEQTNLRLDMKFAKALPNRINVIPFSIYDGQIEITKAGSIFRW